MVNRLAIIGLVLMSCISLIVHSMEESYESQLIERKIKYNEYLGEVEKGLYADGGLYSGMVNSLRADHSEFNGLIEEIDHLVNSYRNQSSVLVRASGRSRERSIDSPIQLQERIKAAIKYRYDWLNNQR